MTRWYQIPLGLLAVLSCGVGVYGVVTQTDMHQGSGRAAAVAASIGGDASYQFLTGHAGTFATWECDQVLDVAVRRGGVSEGVIDDLLVALDTVSETSRVRFQYVGDTLVVPDAQFDTWRAERVDADVVVAFVERDETDLLAAGAAGNGGSWWHSDGKQVRYRSGSVVISIDDLDDFVPGGGYLSRQALFIHELLHVLNLGHTESADSIMTSDLRNSYGMIGAGDLAGLAHLSALACGS